ncbi:hypothetical protein DB30_03582 [Enhygromyxa salina]|uniref:Uncharacterized protein n=2 Tax=Enhygromyxa salina TaxID=215803 RepID=A0A0C2D5L4_9BACT|nr:hypothetical protein DB30_03582 [Enhygromyxa salina]
MLNLTGQWLNDEEFINALGVSNLGTAMLEELKKGHEPLAELKNKRAKAHAKLRNLIDAAGELDILHDRKARSVYYHLHALGEGANDDAKADEYRELQGVLFPDGLNVVKLPFLEEGGAALALERTVSPDMRAKLAAIVVGEHTLDDLFGAWIAAGVALGKVVDQRAELKASLTRTGSAVGEIDLRGGRSRWVKAVNGLLWAIEMDEKLGPLAERVRAALDEAIAAKLRARDSGDDVGASADPQEEVSVAEDPEGDDGESDGEVDQVDQIDQIDGDDVSEVAE